MNGSIFAAALFLTTLAEASTPVQIVEEVTLGEMARIGPVRVRALKVIEDTRCPADAECEKPGRLIVRTEIRELTGRKTRDFQLGQWRQLEQGGALMLKEATPIPMAGGSANPEAYRLTFKFER